MFVTFTVTSEVTEILFIIKSGKTQVQVKLLIFGNGKKIQVAGDSVIANAFQDQP